MKYFLKILNGGMNSSVNEAENKIIFGKQCPLIFKTKLYYSVRFRCTLN